jgi:hypothetical protein
MLAGLTHLPFSWSVQIFDPVLRDKFTNAVWTALGDKTPMKTQDSWQFGLRTDRSWAMARLPQRVLGTGFNSRRLFLRDIDCAAGRRPALSSLSTAQDFGSRIHGNAIVFTHQKVDWIYSIMKGLMLLFDSQARPEAEVIGRYRDTYAAVTVEAKGLRAFAGFYSMADAVKTSAPVEPVHSDLVSLYQQAETDFQTRPAAEAATPGGPIGEARSMGQLTACKSNLKNIATACEMYSTDNAGRYPTSLSQLTPNYLKIIPKCPAADKDTYSLHFRSGRNPDHYSIYCWGHNHAAVSTPANRPAYNSEKGLIDK